MGHHLRSYIYWTDYYHRQ